MLKKERSFEKSPKVWAVTVRFKYKDWAKSPADQKVKSVGNLIKLYQKEIDRYVSLDRGFRH